MVHYLMDALLVIIVVVMYYQFWKYVLWNVVSAP